jgi:hypothetical protein
MQLDINASAPLGHSDAMGVPVSVDPLVPMNPWADDGEPVEKSRATLYGIPLVENDVSHGSSTQDPPLQDWLTLSLSGTPPIGQELTEPMNVEPAHREDEDDEIDPAEALMQRGAQLRQLRALALQDEADRQQFQGNDQLGQQSVSTESVELVDGSRVLQYDSWLAHQLFHDDLKRKRQKKSRVV